MARQTEVLIIDDEEIVCERLREHLQAEGLGVTDLKMKAPNGLDVLHEIRRSSPATQVIIITGYGSIESYSEAQFGGAYEFVPKPFKAEQVAALVKKAGSKAARLK